MLQKLDSPSANRFGVLEAPSPINSSEGLVGSGEWTLEPEGFLADIGADIDGRLFTNPNGRPSSGSLSLEPASCNRKRKKKHIWCNDRFLFVDVSIEILPCEKHCP